MYHTLQSVHYLRDPFQPAPPLSPQNISPWDAADYSLVQVAGNLGDCTTYNYTHPAPLEYPESSQRTFISESSLSNATGHPLQCSTGPTRCGHHPQPSRATDERHSHLNGYYRPENSMYPTTTLPESSSSYDLVHPLHELEYESPSLQNLRCDTSLSSTTLESMLQVFPVQPFGDAQSPAHPLADVSPSTFTFQLGPHSLDQVEDPEPLPTRLSDQSTSDIADDESEENLWEGSALELKAAGSPLHIDLPAQRSTTPPKLPSQLFIHLGGKRSTRKPTHSDPGKRSKMHQCKICEKWFPRPSGLATHMNSHSGLRPFNCPLPSCNKSFAVRSNAKRHLRTHGIIPSPESHKAIKYTVGFDTPVVTDVHEPNEPPVMLRWVPQSLTTWTNMNWPKSIDSESEGEDGYPVLPVPLPPVPQSPKNWDASYPSEDKNAYDEAASQPYHPRHWRGLPGPVYT